MGGQIRKTFGGGINQSGLRDYNERLLLSVIQRSGGLSGSNLAQVAHLSPQAVSVILRKLEGDGLLVRGAPLKGKVGKPSVPMRLAADGVFSIGLKIGRRSADLILIDFLGNIRAERQITYTYPVPSTVFGFLKDSQSALTAGLSRAERDRICGIGIAAPFELWNWHEQVGAPAGEFDSWAQTDFAAEVAAFSPLPVSIVNDATAACQAEHVYGRGKEFGDYAYFYIAAFIGGGVVLNHSVYEGRRKNAGAMGSLRTVAKDGSSGQLIDTASLYLLEKQLTAAGEDGRAIWGDLQSWTRNGKIVSDWMDRTALELARASLSTCAVIDFEAIVIDGAFPRAVREDLVGRVRAQVALQDTRGLLVPRIEAGTIGNKARALGAASGPIFAQFLLNTNVGLSAAS